MCNSGGRTKEGRCSTVENVLELMQTGTHSFNLGTWYSCMDFEGSKEWTGSIHSRVYEWKN